MIWLQNHELHDVLALVYHETGSYEFVTRSVADEQNFATLQGIFSQMSKQFVGVYRRDGQLYLKIEDECIRFSNDIELTVDKQQSKQQLVVVRNGQQIHRLDYENTHTPIPNDPTPFIEEEDFDFGLLLVNLSRSEERKKRFYKVD